MINFSLAYSHTCRAVDSYTLPAPRPGWHSKVFENLSVNFGQFQNESHPVFSSEKKYICPFFLRSQKKVTGLSIWRHYLLTTTAEEFFGRVLLPGYPAFHWPVPSMLDQAVPWHQERMSSLLSSLPLLRTQTGRQCCCSLGSHAALTKVTPETRGINALYSATFRLSTQIFN